MLSYIICKKEEGKFNDRILLAIKLSTFCDLNFTYENFTMCDYFKCQNCLGLLLTLRVTATALMIKSFTDTLISSERKKY